MNLDLKVYLEHNTQMSWNLLLMNYWKEPHLHAISLFQLKLVVHDPDFRFLQNKKLNEQSNKAATYRKKTYEFAVAQQNKIKDNTYLFSPINLGDSINSKSLEYFPSLSIDGKKIVFTRRENNDEDFYESTLQNDKWSAAKLLQGKVNTNLNEGAQNISQDGQLLVFTGCNYPGGQGSCDLYFSLKKYKYKLPTVSF